MKISGDATESVKAEFRLIEHESQVCDKRRKTIDTNEKDENEKSPSKKKGEEKPAKSKAFKRQRK